MNQIDRDRTGTLLRGAILLVALVLARPEVAAGSSAKLFVRSSPASIPTSVLRGRRTMVSVDPDAIRHLRAAHGGAITVPVDDGNEIDVTLVPYPIFADRAVRTVTDVRGARPLPVDLDVYRGTIAGEPRSWAVITLSPHGAFGVIQTRRGRFDIAPMRAAAPGDPDGVAPHVIAESAGRAPNPPAFTCTTADGWPDLPPRSRAGAPSPLAIASTSRLTMDVAIDCDYEFLADKMGFDLFAATNYIVTLAAASSMVYENDLNVTMRISYLNFWSTVSDPYTQGNTDAQLTEFLNYWQANRTDVSRNVAFMVSGRFLGGGQARGIGVMCNRDVSYCVAQLDGTYYYPNPSTTWDQMVFTHEIGHLVGSPHTQSCFWQTNGYAAIGSLLDSCYTAEGTCYSGPTGILPPDRGTIMSYCHLLAPIAQATRLEFHAACKTVIRAYVEQCLPEGGVFDSQIQLAASGSGNQVALSWNPSLVPGVIRYDVYRGTASLEPHPSLIGSTTGTTLADSNRVGAAYYRVRAVRAADQSHFSNEVRFAPCLPIGPVLYTTSFNPVTPALGDWNEDGIMDLCVPNSGIPNATILLGHGTAGVGDGTFIAGSPIPAGSTPTSIVSADFNEDGILDVAMANDIASGTVSVLLGQGTGGVGNATFGARVAYPAGALARSIVAGDWNEDGITDLAVTNNVASGTVTVLLGQGANGIGNGTFAAGVAYGAGSTPLWLASADLNHDGIEDLVVTNYVVSGTVSVLLGQGTGGKGNGTFGSPTSYTAGDRPFGLVVGDFNEDGIVDVAVTNFDNVASVLTGGGSGGVWNGTFAAPVPYPVGSTPQGLAVGDLNTDGIADLMVANRIDGTASLLLGKGTGGVGDGTFEEGAAFFSGQYPQGVAIGDFREDGAPDWVVPKATANGVSVHWGACTGTTPAALTVTSPNGGESWTTGSEQTITWTRAGGVVAVNVETSRDSGRTWETVARNRTGTSFTWTVTAPAATSASAMVRVVDATMPNRQDASDRVFLIHAPGAAVEPVVSARLSINGAAPNPSSRGWTVTFALATREAARIEVLDVTGRRVRVRELGAPGPGAHRVLLAGGAPLPSGVYVIRLRQGARTVTGKVVATR
jgi:hypothetical protein